MNNRRGFAMVAGLFFLVIVLLLAGTRLFFSRQHMHQVARQAEYERSWQLARSALTAGGLFIDGFTRWLNDPATPIPRRNHAPAEYRQLAEALLNETDQFTDERKEQTLDLAILRQWLPEIPEARSISLVIRLDPIQADSPGGEEAGHRLFLLAEATVGNTTARCASFNECRWVSLLPPVVGKFSLLVENSRDLDPNRMLDAMDVKNVKGEPWIVSSSPDTWDDAVAPPAMSERLDRGGWVWLGGEEYLNLRLAEAGGRREARSPCLDEDSYYYDLPDKAGLNPDGNLAFFSRRQRFCRELGSMVAGEALAMKNPGDFAYASLLQPAGSDAAPSPGLVIGHVTRSWVLIQGIHNLARDVQAPLPWLTSAAFSGSQWPGQMSPAAIQRLRSYFDQDFKEYSRRMSTILTEPWNAALVSLVDFGVPPDTRPMIQDIRNLPPGVVAPPRMKRLKIDGSGAAWWEIVPPRSIEIISDQGESLYRGNSPLEACRPEFLQSRATHRFRDWQEFHAVMNRPDGWHLGTVIRVEGDLRLETPVRFNDGGIILVDGSITLEAPLTAPDHAPLTLVSLHGDVTVRLPQPLRASLLAPEGTIQTGDSCQIQGSLAGRRLKLERGATGALRHLQWDPLLDPTDTANLTRQRRLVFSGGWRIAHY